MTDIIREIAMILRAQDAIEKKFTGLRIHRVMVSGKIVRCELWANNHKLLIGTGSTSGQAYLNAYYHYCDNIPARRIKL